MIRLILGHLLLLTLSCTHTSSEPAPRNTASTTESELDEKSVIKYLDKILRLMKEETPPHYKVLRFPMESAFDLTPAIVDLTAELQRLGLQDQVDNSSLILGLILANENSGKIRAELRRITLSHYTRAERDMLLNSCYLGAIHAGDPFYLTYFLNIGLCDASAFFHSPAEVNEALVQFPNHPTGVRYNGALGVHVYTNGKLKNQVQILTASLNTNRDEFVRLVKALPENVYKKFATNSNGSSETAKIEPFDLLSSYTTEMIMRKNLANDEYTGPLNKIQISKLSQKGLARLFLMVNNEDQILNAVPSLTVLKGDNNIHILCANGMFETRQKTRVGVNEWWSRSRLGTDLVESWEPNRTLSTFVEKGFSAVNFTCNTIEYRFLFKKIEAEPIPNPEPIVFEAQQDVYALMTISLVSEIDRSAIDTAKKFVKTLTGWEIEKDVLSVDTLSYVKKALARADAYFPVMHAMDVNYFTLGTTKSLVIQLRKQVQDKNGNKRNIHLSILLPDSKTPEMLVLKPNDLAQMLDTRYKYKKTPIFLMNNSCASQKTIFAWTLVFRKALELRRQRGELKDFSQVTDFPYIIGSDRYFDTANLMQIFSHSQYPLKSLESLANNVPMEQILAQLKEPESSNFLGDVVSFFGSKEKTGNENIGFSPVFVLDHPELLGLGGIKISVTSRAIKSRDEY